MTTFKVGDLVELLEPSNVFEEKFMMGERYEIKHFEKVDWLSKPAAFVSVPYLSQPYPLDVKKLTTAGKLKVSQKDITPTF